MGLGDNVNLSDHQCGFLRQDQHGIYFPILLISIYPLLGTLENHSLLFLISLKHLALFDIRLCKPNIQLTALLLPFVN